MNNLSSTNFIPGVTVSISPGNENQELLCVVVVVWALLTKQQQQQEELPVEDEGESTSDSCEYETDTSDEWRNFSKRVILCSVCTCMTYALLFNIFATLQMQ